MLPEIALAIAALLSVVLVSVGVGLVFLPAGLICAGVVGLAATYVSARAVLRMRRRSP